jgi:hypothetical protein
MSTTATQHVDSYKYQWARYVSRKKLEKDLAFIKKRAGAVLCNVPGIRTDSLSGLAGITDKLAEGGLTPATPGKFKVGIVGAGVAGLFTALTLDWIQKEVGGDLDIDYDILEASPEKRFGGRLFTHYFSTDKNSVHDYYDVGAMRFPKNEVMDRYGVCQTLCYEYQ